MTKKDFEYLAAMLRHARENDYDRNTIEFILGYLTEYCASENPRFNITKFINATKERN